jgi:hypothetical protein
MCWKLNEPHWELKMGVGAGRRKVYAVGVLLSYIILFNSGDYNKSIFFFDDAHSILVKTSIPKFNS